MLFRALSTTRSAETSALYPRPPSFPSLPRSLYRGEWLLFPARVASLQPVSCRKARRGSFPGKRGLRGGSYEKNVGCYSLEFQGTIDRRLVGKSPSISCCETILRRAHCPSGFGCSAVRPGFGEQYRGTSLTTKTHPLTRTLP